MSAANQALVLNLYGRNAADDFASCKLFCDIPDEELIEIRRRL
ncbi:hypothetical protein [Bradyrhizobium sp. USDA 10063]